MNINHQLSRPSNKFLESGANLKGLWGTKKGRKGEERERERERERARERERGKGIQKKTDGKVNKNDKRAVL